MATKKTDTDPAAADSAPDAHAELDAWFARHIPDSRFAQDTGTYNRIFNHVEGIKRALGEAPPAASAVNAAPSAQADNETTE